METIQISQGSQGLDEFWYGPDGLNNIIQMGLRVIPVNPGAKKPSWRNWQFGRDEKPYSSSSSTTDRARLEGAFNRDPRPNAGIPTGQPWQGRYLCVMDIDPRHGGDEGLTKLCDELGRPPLTATVRSKSGGSHIYVLCRLPWQNAPNELAPGVEFKRAGQFVVVPPSNGYTFVRSPFGDPDVGGISGWSRLEELVGLQTAARAAGQMETHLGGAIADLPSPPNPGWTSIDDYLVAIATAAPGNRHATLLSLGGKVAYATALGVGLGSPAAVEAALWKAIETNGLANDYPAEEVLRKIGTYVAWSDATANPLLNGQKPALGQHRQHPPVLNPLQWGRTTQVRDARQSVLRSLGSFARMEHRPYAASYGAAWTGLPATNVQRALGWLCANNLIERGPSVYSPDGKRPTHTYRVTPQGKVVLRGLA
jgi:hypothetical protein